MHPKLTALLACGTLAALLFSLESTSFAGGLTCAPSDGPDVIVGDLVGWGKWGTVGSIAAYTFGTTSCNIGNQVLPWVANSNSHPVIAQNMYRLKNGRFEQIGLSWVKHGWGASAENVCCTCVDPQNFEALGIGCSDPYDAGTNAIQAGFTNNGVLVSGLGPRSDVNARTGGFPWPYTTQGQAGNVIYKRLQVALSDLDPAQNAGAMYFAEGQYITPHDNYFRHPNNNVSYRQFTVGSLTSGSYTLSFPFNFTIQREKPAIAAWAAADAGVDIQVVDIANDGRIMLGTRVTNNGNGTWHYEYALYNMNSHASIGAFAVPLPAAVSPTNIGFHDVNYHSGEIYDGTDWIGAPVSNQLKWSTTPFATNPNANALRWGTLYNFRFDAAVPPRPRNATASTFRTGLTGVPASVTISTQAPMRAGDANNDGAVNIDDLLTVITGWGPCPAGSPCFADISPLTGNGTVNIDDLLAVINNWD
jgi:hypothetical protein